MSGMWLRCEVEGRSGLEAAITDHRERGEPVHPFLAVCDLRWWQSRILAPGSRIRMPTAAEFARRWTWGEKRARLLLAREEEWCDPRMADAWEKHRGRNEDGQKTESGRDEDGIDKGSKPKTSGEGRNEDGQKTESGRKKGDTRVVDHDHDHDHDHKEDTASPVAPLVLAPKAPDEKPPKPKRAKSPKTPETAWVRQMADRWVAAFGPGYAFDWFKDRQSLARCAAAVGVELNAPLPSEALDHLQRAMSAYISAARRDDPTCWPKGLPTIGGFVLRLSEWVMKTARAPETATPSQRFAGVRTTGVEARILPLLKAGESIDTVRAKLAATTKLNADEIAYGMYFLDQQAARAAGSRR